MSGPAIGVYIVNSMSFLTFHSCLLLSASVSIILILKMGGGDVLLSSHFLTLKTGSLFGIILDFALSFFTLLIKNSLKILASFAGFVINSGGSPSFSV